MMLPEQMTTTLPGQNDDDAIRADDELMMVLQEQTTIGHGVYEATETDDDVDTGANNIGQRWGYECRHDDPVMGTGDGSR